MSGTGLARVGDTFSGTCSLHSPFPIAYTGTWTSSSCSPTTTADGRFVIRSGDYAPASCGHNFKATGASSACSADGLALHRVGDAGVTYSGSTNSTSTGTTNSGSPDVDSL